MECPLWGKFTGGLQGYQDKKVEPSLLRIMYWIEILGLCKYPKSSFHRLPSCRVPEVVAGLFSEVVVAFEGVGVSTTGVCINVVRLNFDGLVEVGNSAIICKPGFDKENAPSLEVFRGVVRRNG